MNYEQITGEGQPMEEDENVDPIWTSSRTARQIYALTMVEKDISKLLALAASSVSLLTLPQTDPPESTLPQGEERSEQFVVEVTEYFNKLDSISQNMRWVLAQIAKARIAPSAIEAPPPSFIPQPMGVGTPSTISRNSKNGAKSVSQTETESREEESFKLGLQEERINRDAWRGILDALQRLKQTQDREDGSRSLSQSQSSMND